MSIIPTALGGGQRLDQLMMATDVFDTPGTSSWSHPSPGTPLEVQVTLVGGAGGGTSGSAAGNGTKTVWDVSGSPVTANSGSGAINGTTPGNGFLSGTHMESTNTHGPNAPTLMNGLYGNAGHSKEDQQSGASTGGSGYIEQFRTTVTTDINIIVGKGGTSFGTFYDGQNGAVIVSYAKAAVGIPAPVQKEFVEEWLDYDSTVGGSGTWIHPRPGQAITMTVICVGGGSASLRVATNNTANSGGNTTFGSVTALGATGATSNGSVWTARGNGTQNNCEPISGNEFYTFVPQSGHGLFGSVEGTQGASASGFVTIDRITVTGNVNYSIGQGGTALNSNEDNGLPGGIILKYSK